MDFRGGVTAALARAGLDRPELWARAARDELTGLALGLALQRAPELLAELEHARYLIALGGGRPAYPTDAPAAARTPEGASAG